MTRSSKYCDQPRRQSPRLKGLNVIYEAEDAKVLNAYPYQQQIGRYSDVNVSKVIKFEIPDPEESKFCTQQENTNVAMECDSDELCIVSITLKDLKEGCRAKKRKCLKSFTQNADVRNHATLQPSQMVEYTQSMEPIQEDPDLLEPIITSRQKTRKLFTANRKRKKHVDALNTSQCQEDVLAESSCILSDPAQVASRCSTITIELPITERISIHLAEITDSAKKDVGIEKKKYLSEAGTSAVSLPFASERDLQINTHVPNLASYAKSETLDSSSDWHNGDVGWLNSCLNVQSHGSSLSHTELLYKCSRTGSQSNESSLFMIPKCDDASIERREREGCFQPEPEVKTDYDSDNPPYHNIKSEVMENDSPLQNHSSSDADSTDYIGTFSHSEGSSFDQFQGVNEDAHDKVKCTSSLCCIDVGSPEPEESINDHLPRSDFDECGIEVSSLSNYEPLKFLSSETKEETKEEPCTHQLVSTSKETVPDRYSCTEIENNAISLKEGLYESGTNQVNISLNCHSNGRMKKQDDCSSHLVNGGTLDDTDNRSQDSPIYCQKKDVATNKDLLPEKVYGLEEIFLSSTERCSFFDLVDKGVSRNPDKDDKESTSNHTEEPLCSSLSNSCFSAVNDSHATAVSCNTDFSSEVEDVLESQCQEVNISSDSSEIENSVDLRKLNSQTSGTSPLCISAPSESLPTDESLLKAADNSSSLLTEENLFPSYSQPISKAKGIKIAGKRSSILEQSSTLFCPPKKLLSHRKIISPTSQEKLSKTMSDIYLNDLSHGPDQKETESSPCEMIKKSRRCVNGLLSPTKKVTVMSQNTSCSIACPCIKSSSVNSHMEKAIEFSQQQMNDIEKLATQLLKGLNSMKSIVEETQTSDICSSLPSNFTSDEIRAAAENAAELEKTTKKWLYIMTKDCTRFCKIMRSAANDFAAPANGVHKGRRKITFADEVGGPLCHVKVFDHRSSPTSILETEQAIQQASAVDVIENLHC